MNPRPNPPERQQIVFLYSDTGGGHRSAAEAICEGLELEFPGRFDLQMVDFLRHYAPRGLNRLPDIYPTLSQFPHLWEVS